MMAMETTDMEKRKRSRIQFSTTVLIQTDSGKKIEGKLNDISINGLYVKSQKSLQSGESCDVKIILTGKNNKLTLEAKGWLARKDKYGFGIQFKDDLEWWSLFSIYAPYGKPEKAKKPQVKKDWFAENAPKCPLKLVSSDGVWYKQVLPMMDSQKKRFQASIPNYALGYI